MGTYGNTTESVTKVTYSQQFSEQYTDKLQVEPGLQFIIRIGIFYLGGVTMFQLMQRSVLVLAACVCCQATVYAQNAQNVGRDVTVDLAGRKIVQAGGKEVRESAAQAKPGDQIEYVATYTNGGKSGVKDLVATLPIPQDTDYVGGSAQPAGAQAATRDGVFGAIPLKRKVKQPDGKEVERDVPLTEYRTLRWPVGELAAGKNFVATARVRLSTEPIAAPAAAPAAGVNPAPAPAKATATAVPR